MMTQTTLLFKRGKCWRKLHSKTLHIFLILCIVPSLISLLHTQEEVVREEGRIEFQEIIVKEKDTLWSIANYYLKDPQQWPQILKYNKLDITNPHQVLPGMKLKVPVLLIKEHLRASYLIKMINDVKYRRRDTNEWKKAYLNMQLLNNDSVKTGKNSYGKVKFYSGEILTIDQNSLVILRPEYAQEEAELLIGDIRGRRTRVVTPSAVIEPKVLPTMENTDYRVKVKEDKTTLVAVYKGAAEVTAQNKTVRITEGFGTEVKYLSPPSEPIPLPDIPEISVELSTSAVSLSEIKLKEDKLLQVPQAQQITARLPDFTIDNNLTVRVSFPEYSQKKVERNLPAATTLSQTPPKTEKIARTFSLKEYHLQVSTDETFKKIVLEETRSVKEKIELKKMLPDGTYWWRVAFVDELGFESDFSTPKMIIIDREPPKIDINSPAQNAIVKDDFVAVEGITEPNVYLTINGKLVSVDDTGKFSTVVYLPNIGKNSINFFAKDANGNVTEKTLYVEKAATKKESYTEEKKETGKEISSTREKPKVEVKEKKEKESVKKYFTTSVIVFLTTITGIIILYVIFSFM
jgi:hypothetical protein